MAVSAQDIVDFLLANPDMSDAQIASIMDQYGVSPADVAEATGVSPEFVQAKYEAAVQEPEYTPPSAPEPEPVYEPPAPVYTPEPVYTAPEPVYTPPSRGAKLELEPENLDVQPPPSAPDAPSGIASLTPAQASTPATPSAVDKLTQQILAQGTTSQWKGEGFGSAEKNAADMAKILADTGITDIKQFGKVTKTVDEEVRPDGAGGFIDARGNPVDASKVNQQVQSGEAGDTVSYTAPVGKQEVFGNKATGQTVADTYGERQTGNAFGGTYTGEGNTGYRVQFDASGNPIFYTTKASSSDIGDLAPILAIASFVPALAPFAQAINAAIAIDRGDILGGIASLAGVAGMSEVSTGLKVVKALDDGNPMGIVGALMADSGLNKLASTTMIADGISFADAGNTLKVIDNLSKGDLTGALTTAANLSGSSDAQTAAAGLTLVNAVKTGDLTQIASAAGGLNNTLNATNNVATQLQNSGLVNNSDAASFADANTADDTDTQISNQLNKDLTIDASGAKDVNAAAAFADAAGFTQFTFDGKTYTLGNNNAANTIADLESEALKTNTAATTAENLAGGEFEGVDAQIAANAKANTTAIGNAEADSLEEAASLAKIRNPTGTTFTFDGKTYTLGTSNSVVDQAIADAKASNLQTEIANAPNRDAAFKIAREGLGANKTFTYNGKEYSTATAEERPDLTGKTTTTTTTEDQSAAETARLLAKNKTLEDASTANQSNAEVNRLLAKNADLITGNVTANQSAAETARLANLNNTLVLGNAPNESAAETQRLVEAGERSVAQNLNTFALQTLGTTARGAASLIQNAGETYAQLTGDFNYDNVATKLGKEIAEYAKGKDVYGLDVQKNRLAQSLTQADNTDNFFEKTAIIGSAIKKNPLGFFDIAGSEFVEELPETAIQIAAALLTGGGSAAVQMGGKFIAGTTSLVGSFAETFGAAGKEAFQKSIARGDSVDVAKDKSYINAAINAVAEMVPDYFADKALIGPIMKNFAEKTLKSIGAGYATNTAAGVVSEFISGAAQNYSTQYVVDPTKASWSKAITNGIFESTIGGTVQTAMATPNTVIDTGAVIGRDYSGNNVTLQQVLDGNSNIDATTVNASTPIATKADGSSMTVGSSILFAQENNTGMDVLGSFLPANLTGTDVVVATDSTITAEQAQQVMADLGLNVSDDVAISLASKISGNTSNEVTLGDIITDMTGKPANLTGKSDTSTVISVDTGAGTAVVMDSKGNTDVVNVSGDAKVGSVVNVNAATNTATTTGKTVDTAANTATVVSVDAASGKAIVADSNGSSQVVNTSGDVQVGSTVTVNAGTATATNAATATAANAATNIAVTNAATTAADTSANAATTATTAANAATTSAADANAASTANAATSTAANAATTAAAATDVATNAAAATNTATASNAAANAATATDVATNAADVATNVVADTATTPAVSTSQAVDTSTVVSVDKLDNSVLVQKPDGTFDVISNPGNLTVGDVIGQPTVIEPPVVAPVVSTPAVTPVVTTPVTTPTTTIPTTKTPATPTTPTQTGGVGGGAAEATPPPLANVFYYGKDFGTQKQQVGPGGRLQQAPYQALSVSTPGAEAPVAQQARTEENSPEAMLQKILSQQDENVTMDELIRLLG